jgi:hypothetical protein
MCILRSATTISPTVQADALSDIDIDSPPAIRREPKNPVLRVSFVFRWVVGRGKYYIDRPNDGYTVEDEKLLSELEIIIQFYRGSFR